MSFRSKFGWIAFFIYLSLTAPFAHAAAEGDVFARILARLTAQESMSVGHYLLHDSPEIRELSRAILGAEANGIAEGELTETAIRRLKDNSNSRLANELERRLIGIENDFTAEIERAPGADPELILKRLSSERLRMQSFADSSSLSDSERALSDSLGNNPEIVRLRNAAKTAAADAEVAEAKIGQSLKAYEKLLKSEPKLARYLPKAEVYAQLADEEMIDFSLNLQGVLARIKKAPGRMETKDKIRSAFEHELHGKVPARSIPERVRALLAGEKDAFRRALGDMTLEETQELFYGKDPLKPSSDSLIGQYIAETGATTTVRTFDDAAAEEAGKRGAQGPKKLVVSLSEKSFPAFMKLFKRKEWMSIMQHAWMIHDGQVTTHMQALSDLRVPGSEYTPFPVLLLKPTEGQRVAQYLKLFRRAPWEFGMWDSKATAPWALNGYSARSSWANGCTQHVGNMPIGDELMDAYAMPGGNDGGRNALNPRPNVQKLKAHGDEDPLVRRVWKTPGNMQLGETIGQKAANLRGELANPGWLIWTLLGPTSVDRVPIVFVARPDHTLPIERAFEPVVEGRN